MRGPGLDAAGDRPGGLAKALPPGRRARNSQPASPTTTAKNTWAARDRSVAAARPGVLTYYRAGGPRRLKPRYRCPAFFLGGNHGRGHAGIRRKGRRKSPKGTAVSKARADPSRATRDYNERYRQGSVDKGKVDNGEQESQAARWNFRTRRLELKKADAQGQAATIHGKPKVSERKKRPRGPRGALCWGRATQWRDFSPVLAKKETALEFRWAPQGQQLAGAGVVNRMRG